MTSGEDRAIHIMVRPSSVHLCAPDCLDSQVLGSVTDVAFRGRGCCLAFPSGDCPDGSVDKLSGSPATGSNSLADALDAMALAT